MPQLDLSSFKPVTTNPTGTPTSVGGNLNLSTFAPKYDPRTDPSNQKMIQAGQDAFKQPSTFAGVIPDIKGIASAAMNYAVKAPLQFGLSLGEIAKNPKDYLQGKASDQTYNVPVIGDVQSIQSEYQKSLANGADPSSPFTFVKPEMETFAGAAPLLGAGKVVGDVPLTGENAGQFQPGSIQKGIQSLMNKPIANQFQNVLDSTMPKVTPKVGAEAISNAGKPGGATPGSFGTSSIQPTAKDLQRASDVMPFYDKDPVKFASNINGGIGDVSKNVEGYLQANPANGDPQELLSRINKIEAPTLASSDQATAVERVKDIAKELINPADKALTTDEVLNRLNDIVGGSSGQSVSIPGTVSSTNVELANKVRGLASDMVDEGVSRSNFESVLRDQLSPAEQKILDTPTPGSPVGNIKRTTDEMIHNIGLHQELHPITNSDLWASRKVFDNRIDAAKNSIVDPEKLKALNIAVNGIRQEWNNYIGEITDGSQQFTDQLSTLHNMYDAVDNLGENYGKTVGMSAGKIFALNHPTVAKALKIGKVGAGLGLLTGAAGVAGGAAYKLFNWATGK